MVTRIVSARFVPGLVILAGFGADAQEFDWVLRGGTVVDGTGAPGRIADIGIRGDRISAVGTDIQAGAEHEIDVSGLVVAPGFIDVHNHSEHAIAREKQRFNEGFVRQGVTTITGGADGSLAPGQMRRLIAGYAEHGIGTNVTLYVGHNALRREVMGRDQQRAPTADELDAMRGLVREGMELGAVGLSSGLMYEPGMFSETSELIELAKVVKAYGGIYDSHVRDPVHAFLASHTECAEIGREAGIPSKLGHLKGVGLQNSGVIHDVIRMVDHERINGHLTVSDQYPYDGAATSTIRDIVIVPAEVRDNDFDLNAALNDPTTKAAIREASENGIDGGFAWLKATGYKSMRITHSEDYPELVGEYLWTLAGTWEVEPFDVVARLIAGAEHPVYITLGAILEEDVRALMVQPWNMIASDGEYVDSTREAPGGHPRSTGTFPRVLGHYVRDEGVLSLEEAVRKMTALPADTIGLPDRGRIQVGAAADLAIFDPETIRDRSTWTEPRKMPVGMVHVFVNGLPALRDGELTGESPGRFLRMERN